MVMPANEWWAQAFGYLSIFCWIVVFTPQLHENYVRKNTDSVSIPFLLFWIFGDIFNLLGVMLENLLVTMLLLALYYLLADVLLMGQVVYYRKAPSALPVEEQVFDSEVDATPRIPTDDENAPLLRTRSEDRSSGHTLSSRHAKTVSPYTRKIMRIFFVTSVLLWVGLLTGSLLFFFYPPNKVDLSQLHLLSQLLGWASAVLYCCSRIPQIMQNFRNESVEGLSLTMFMFSVVGNLTYCMSIFCNSTDRTYLLINFPWILGSGGTLFFDFTIFFQFYTYRAHKGNLSKQDRDEE